MTTSITASCLCLKMRMTSRSMAIFYEGMLYPTELTSSQFSVLRNIDRFVPRGMSDLAAVMLLDRTTLTRNISVLEERGFARLAADGDDGRTRRPMLTQAGLDKLRAAIPKWRVAQSRILGGLGQHGWSELLLALRHTAAINEETPQRLYGIAREPAYDRNTAGRERDMVTIACQRCVNSTLRGASRYITNAYDRALRCHEIKITQLHILAAIAENARLRVTDLAMFLALDQATVTLALSGLRSRGWVGDAGRADGGGSRGGRRYLVLTAAGSSVLDAATPDWQRCQEVREAGGSDQVLRWGAALDKALAVALQAMRA